MNNNNEITKTNKAMGGDGFTVCCIIYPLVASSISVASPGLLEGDSFDSDAIEAENNRNC